MSVRPSALAGMCTRRHIEARHSDAARTKMTVRECLPARIRPRKRPSSEFLLEVDALLLHHQGSFVDLGVNRPNVLPEYADEEELHGAEEVDTDE
jgi:hypothetical protein